MNTNSLREAKELIKRNNTASLATASPDDASPEVSIVYYWYDDDRSLYCATLIDSRKMQNIVPNNKVALTIVDIIHKQELQIEGNAYIVDNPDDINTHLNSIHKVIEKNEVTHVTWPILSLHPNDLAIVRIIIDRFKYSNFAGEPVIVEGTYADWISHVHS